MSPGRGSEPGWAGRHRFRNVVVEAIRKRLHAMRLFTFRAGRGGRK